MDDRILSSNPHKTLAGFEAMSAQIAEDIRTRSPEIIRGVTRSLGAVALCHIFGEQGIAPQSIELTVPGGNLAESLWTGARTQPLRREYENQGITLPTLKELWKTLAPTFQAKNIHGAKVEMFISGADHIIMPQSAYELADAYTQSQNEVSVIANKHLGHYGTILRQSFKPKYLT